MKLFLLTLLVLGLPINALVRCDDDYNIGFQTNAEMVYEYSYVNITLLIQLAVEDYSYNGFYTIPQGIQIKWKVISVVEIAEGWLIGADVYRGEAFDTLAGDFETIVYENPNDLSTELYNGTGNELYFIPINVANYLNLMNRSIPFLNENHSYILNNSIVFDHTKLGANDTIMYTFNEHGIMKSYQIYYNGSLAFSFELKSFSLGGFEIILLSVIISSLVSIFCISVYIIIRKRRSRKSGGAKRLLRTIR